MRNTPSSGFVNAAQAGLLVAGLSIAGCSGTPEGRGELQRAPVSSVMRSKAAPSLPERPPVSAAELAEKSPLAVPGAPSHTYLGASGNGAPWPDFSWMQVSLEVPDFPESADTGIEICRLHDRIRAQIAHIRVIESEFIEAFGDPSMPVPFDVDRRRKALSLVLAQEESGSRAVLQRQYDLCWDLISARRILCRLVADFQQELSCSQSVSEAPVRGPF